MTLPQCCGIDLQTRFSFPQCCGIDLQTRFTFPQRGETTKKSGKRKTVNGERKKSVNRWPLTVGR
jgi:hypothetical protein